MISRKGVVQYRVCWAWEPLGQAEGWAVNQIGNGQVSLILVSFSSFWALGGGEPNLADKTFLWTSGLF